ncbi:hypothetical protein [Janthinobacterium svalbardensis]|uniref:hypothetical protein n=1 Tax=Janthinobacterium svalbardensis TaxID=368607 RepID=UPI0012FE4F6B|nr:hypothetical protein [Janthinobacterium svalbardensis]
MTLELLWQENTAALGGFFEGGCTHIYFSYGLWIYGGYAKRGKLDTVNRWLALR